MLDALAVLALAAHPMPISDLRSSVKANAEHAVFLHLVPQTIMSQRGRTIAQIPSLHGASEAERETAMRMHMMQAAARHQDVVAVGLIEPARQEILLEHGPGIPAAGLRPLFEHNPMVPPGREDLFAFGIWAGLVGDFAVAAHLLAPQLEHAIRCLLQRQGVLVSSHDDQGIEREDDLGKLLDRPEAMALFGPDLHFDLLGLLVRPAGSNLRNRIAHGLVPAAEFEAPRFSYFWWLMLRMFLIPLLAADERVDADGPLEGA